MSNKIKLIGFKKYTTEELDDSQKAKVANWRPASSKVKSQTDHFFGKGNDEVIEHLGPTDKSEVHKAIERHLNLNISTEEYNAGQITDRHGRKVNIGKVISKHNNSELLQQFQSDNTRSGKRNQGLHVLVTRSPEGVAGQTSGNQSWSNESCKNIDTGAMRNYLQREVTNGTVVSYLKNHRGDEIARATFQPHRNENGDTVYDLNGVYGIKHQPFIEHATKLQERLSHPLHDASHDLYTIDPGVYNDKSQEHVLHPSLTGTELGRVFSTAQATDNEEAMKAAVRHHNTTEDIHAKAIRDRITGMAALSSVAHTAAAETHYDRILDAAASNEKLHVHLARNPHIRSEHVDKMLEAASRNTDHDDGGGGGVHATYMSLANNQNKLNDRQKRTLVSRIPTTLSTSSVAAHQDLVMNHGTIEHKRYLAKYTGRHENINKLYDLGDDEIKKNLSMNRNTPTGVIDKLVTDPSDEVRQHVAQHSPKLSSEHINMLRADQSPTVRSTIRNRMATRT